MVVENQSQVKYDMIGGFQHYTDLSDFINRTYVGRTDTNEAVILTGCIDNIPITLIGFKTDPDKSDYEIFEEGYDYYLKLCEEIKKRKDG